MEKRWFLQVCQKKNSKVSKSKKKLEISKFYLGIGAGVAFRGGDINYWNNYSTGINLNFLNLGYRFNDTFGVSANWNSSAHTLGIGSAVGIGYLSIGGIFSIPTNYFTVDIKPQYAPRVLALFNGAVLDNLGLYESYLFGRGFVFSNSMVRSTGKGFSYSLDLDFLLSKFNEARLDGIY